MRRDERALRVRPSGSDQLAEPLIELAIRLGALFLCLYLSWVLIRPFITVAIWSVVITIALYPTFNWLVLRFDGRQRLAAVLVSALGLLIVIGPTTWLILGLIDSVRLVIDHFDTRVLALPSPPESVKLWPIIGKPINEFWQLATTNLEAVVSQVLPHLKPFGRTLLRLVGDATVGIITLLAAVVFSGFLLLSTPRLARAFTRASLKLSPTRGEELLLLSAKTIRTVLKGAIGISIVQAVLAGIGLLVAGVPGAPLITSAVLLCSIIQIGPSLILIPVIIWSWTAMDPFAASVFTGYMILVNFIDNVLRPFVLSHGSQVPAVVIMIGVMGGLVAYGITGIFLGPIVLGVLWTLLTAWIDERAAPPL